MEINGKKVEVRKLQRKDIKGKLIDIPADDVQDVMISIATGLTLEEIMNLSLADYFKLAQEFNQLNNVGSDFQEPQAK